MPDITRNGVCYTIEHSPFYEEVDGYRFYFSSETHRRKFFEKARIRQNWLTDSLSRRFHFHLDASLVAIFQLYSQVESRGFYVVSERGEEFSCLEQLRFQLDGIAPQPPALSRASVQCGDNPQGERARR